MSRPGRSGPQDTFEAVFVVEYPKMVALAAAVTGSRSQAEDAAQEAMLKLHKNWDRVGAYEQPDLWLRRVTINQALSWRRRALAEAKAVLRMGPGKATLPPNAGDDDVLWQAIAGLPPMQRKVLALRHLEGYALTEIARLLGISPSTARVHLHRARETLRSKIAADQSFVGEAR